MGQAREFIDKVYCILYWIWNNGLNGFEKKTWLDLYFKRWLWLQCKWCAGGYLDWRQKLLSMGWCWCFDSDYLEQGLR